MIAAASEAHAAPAEGHWPLRHLLGDLRVQHGIKLGLAGVLALYITQLMRLPHTNWSTLTVLILMLPKYVGATAIKASMRALGTIAGALIGIWLIGDYTSTPSIFLPAFFLIVAYATYQFGKLPASQVAYAHFLVGVTTVAVVSDAVLSPDQAWQIGLDRALEILVGVASSLLVTAVVWPRYAREEFAEVGRDALETLHRAFALQAHGCPVDAPADAKEMRQAFDSRLVTLRNLLQAGSRESSLFYTRLSNYESFLLFLIRLFHATLDIRQWSEPETFILDQMRGEVQALENAISEEFEILIESCFDAEEMRPSNLTEAFEAFQSRARQLRDQDFFLTVPTPIAMGFAGHFSALHSVRDNLIAIRSAMINQSAPAQPPPRAETGGARILPAIDWFWVKMGIRSSLAAVISILLLEWVNPPGAGSIAFMAWTLSFQGLVYLRSGGTGDMRIIQNAALAALGLVLVIVLLLLATPFLASYTAMNLALFFILFAFGFLTAGISGVNIWMQIALLATSAFVGLNPQQPVPSQTIIDTFIGIIIGLGIGAMVARLMWPVLPQRILRNSLLAIIARRRAMLCGSALGANPQTELVLLSVEALHAAQQIRLPRRSATEKAGILAFVRAFLAAGTRIRHLVSKRDSLPEPARPFLRPAFERLEQAFVEVLDAFAECFRQGDSSREFPSLRGLLSEMTTAVDQARNSRAFTRQTLEVPLQMLDIANRYRATADALEECTQLLRTLKIQKYWGDYVL